MPFGLSRDSVRRIDWWLCGTALAALGLRVRSPRFLVSEETWLPLCFFCALAGVGVAIVYYVWIRPRLTKQTSGSSDVVLAFFGLAIKSVLSGGLLAIAGVLALVWVNGANLEPGSKIFGGEIVKMETRDGKGGRSYFLHLQTASEGLTFEVQVNASNFSTAAVGNGYFLSVRKGRLGWWCLQSAHPTLLTTTGNVHFNSWPPPPASSPSPAAPGANR